MGTQVCLLQPLCFIISQILVYPLWARILCVAHMQEGEEVARSLGDV